MADYIKNFNDENKRLYDADLIGPFQYASAMLAIANALIAYAVADILQ